MLLFRWRWLKVGSSNQRWSFFKLFLKIRICKNEVDLPLSKLSGQPSQVESKWQPCKSRINNATHTTLASHNVNSHKIFKNFDLLIAKHSI